LSPVRASGLGEAITRRFIAEGASVSSPISSGGGTTLATDSERRACTAARLTREPSWLEALGAVQKRGFGGLDILRQHAGITRLLGRITRLRAFMYDDWRSISSGCSRCKHAIDLMRTARLDINIPRCRHPRPSDWPA